MSIKIETHKILNQVLRWFFSKRITSSGNFSGAACHTDSFAASKPGQGPRGRHARSPVLFFCAFIPTLQVANLAEQTIKMQYSWFWLCLVLIISECRSFCFSKRRWPKRTMKRHQPDLVLDWLLHVMCLKCIFVDMMAFYIEICTIFRKKKFLALFKKTLTSHNRLFIPNVNINL